MRSARVIGAGLSGLAAAWRLAQAGVDVEILERNTVPGGLIGTLKTPDGLVERGANAFVWNDTTARWFAELGIDPAFPRPESRRRYIFRDGRARRWPLGPGETAGMAARAALAWLGGTLGPTRSESVAAWSRRALGPAAADWLIAPALQGIYAAPPDRLSAAALRAGRTPRQSKARRRRARSVAPRGGMGEFIERLADKLQGHGVSFRFGAVVDRLDPTVPTIVATDVGTAACLLEPHAPALAKTAASIETTSILPVTAFFDPHPDDIHGFGVLFPRGCGVDALGVLFNADIFEGRATRRSETWIYGSSGRPAGLPADDELRAIIERDRAVLTGRRDAPVAVRSAWIGAGRPSLPIYGQSVLDIADRLHDLPPWLALAGNYLGRLGVARLLDVADEAARRLEATAFRSARA